MKQDPPEIYGWRVFIIAATACLGGILFGMDTGTMGGVLVLPAFKKEFGLDGLGKIESANLSANIVSALQAGCFLGAIVAWPLADSIGRRTALITAAVIATAGTAMQAASSGYLQAVYAGRYPSPRVVYKDNKADFVVQGGRWHRCGDGFSGSPIIRLRECTTSHPRCSHWPVPVFYRTRDNDQLLDRLCIPATPQWQRDLDCPDLPTSSAVCSSLLRDAPVQ